MTHLLLLGGLLSGFFPYARKLWRDLCVECAGLLIQLDALLGWPGSLFRVRSVLGCLSRLCRGHCSCADLEQQFAVRFYVKRGNLLAAFRAVLFLLSDVARVHEVRNSSYFVSAC
jgi:hypothetical protein